MGPLGAEEAVPFLWEELGKFGECGRGERQKKETGACPAKTRSSKKEPKATDKTSEVLKKVYLEPQGQNFAPIQSLLRLETLACLQE